MEIRNSEGKLPTSLKNLDLNKSHEPKNKIPVSAYLSSSRSRKPPSRFLTFLFMRLSVNPFLFRSLSVQIAKLYWQLRFMCLDSLTFVCWFCLNHRNLCVETRTSISCQLVSWCCWEAFRRNHSLFIWYLRHLSCRHQGCLVSFVCLLALTCIIWQCS